jgi:Zn-finger nucleic acid-binding protein
VLRWTTSFGYFGATNADKWVRWADFDVFAAAEKTGEHGRRNCAECGKPMAVLEYPHSKVTVDVCPSDQGVWLDRGEFQSIVKALDELVDKISARDYEHIALHELKEIIAGGVTNRALPR